jgi:predicted dehydrogenase
VSETPLLLGLVGCGRLAEAGYLPALAGLDNVILEAVVDPKSERRSRISALASSAPGEFQNVAELAKAGAIDAAIIASPVGSHLADARTLAAAGIPCLVEKPPAVDEYSAQALARLTPAPAIGFNRRFTHGAKLVGSVPDDGPVELELEIRYRRASWGAVAVGDAAVLDLAPHLVDLALLLTGAAEADVVEARLDQERARIELETERGRVRIRCATDRAHRERIAVRVGGRTVATSSEGGAVGLVTSRLPGSEHPLVASLRAQLAAFAGSVRGEDRGLLADAEDGVRTMRVIDAARAVAA